MKILLKKYKKYILDDVDINQILVYLENSQIGKLEFEYGEEMLDICLEYYESKEDFEKCAEIWRYRNIRKKY